MGYTAEYTLEGNLLEDETRKLETFIDILENFVCARGIEDDSLVYTTLDDDEQDQYYCKNCQPELTSLTLEDRRNTWKYAKYGIERHILSTRALAERELCSMCGKNIHKYRRAEDCNICSLYVTKFFFFLKHKTLDLRRYMPACYSVNVNYENKTNQYLPRTFNEWARERDIATKLDHILNVAEELEYNLILLDRNVEL
ncbi:uncharacterized protein LOC143187757 [Calliopsis andreniformis]|uniref:uncharacterized protein LOC143187757 n=1 Tax=Calliopsis andreniformis TaxID=337506 RepID=UPI003FCC6DD5